MKKIFLSLSCVLFCCMASAQDETRSFQWRPSELILPAGGVIRNTLHDPVLYLPDGTRQPSPSSMRVRQAQAMVTLFTNPYLATPYAQPYSVDIRFRIKHKNFSGSEELTDYVRLHIDYNPESGTGYQAKDSYQLPNVHHATILIDSIAVTDAEGGSLPTASLGDLYFLRFQLQLERVYEPQPTVAPAIQLIKRSQNNGYLKFSWRPLQWAKQYDVEWTFVDDYHETTGLPIVRENLPYNFKNNSTRIRTKATNYEIPLVFERGYVLFRVRGVGSWGEHLEQEIPGQWSMQDVANQLPPVRIGPAGELPNGVFQITSGLQHETRKNWQYVATFTEEGKRTDVVQYMDGTLRNRQTLSSIVSTKNLMVGETIYDHQGRPAVEILPSPFQLPRDPGAIETRSIYLTDQPALRFVPTFNAGNVGDARVPYRREHFDKDDPEGCNLLVKPLDAGSGSGNYYSPRNPDLTHHEAYVPDAHGYPFSHIEYTPDKTGRIRRQGQAGVAFQLGSGHEVKYYYSTPSQQELDRIFGNEVGIASHYKKEMSLDPNGQAHVSYKNSQGKVVATALAGESPTNLNAIDHPAAQTITLNLLEEENRRETGTSSVVSSRSITISQPTSVQFQYQLTTGTYDITSCPAAGTLCYDCVYDLSIQVYDDCGTVLYNVSQSIGTLDNLRSCNPAPFSSNATLSLTPGSYIVAKRLTVNQQAVDRYVDDYLNVSCFLNLRTDLEHAAESGVDSSTCEASCTPCSHVTIDASYTMQRADGTEQVVHVPVSVRTENNSNCINTCGVNAGGCEAYYESMLADMSPSGQYALYLDSTRRDTNPLGEVNPNAFPLSILNEGNSLPAKRVSWRTPIVDYRNPTGEIARIEISAAGQPAHLTGHIEIIDGKRFVKPQYLSDVQDFISRWQSSWAESLVLYHPEYHYYTWCLEQRQSHRYDSTMHAVKTYAEASSANLINHRSLGLLNDPFFQENPDAIPMMTDSLNHFFMLDTLSRPEFNLDETVYLIINCNNINFNDTQVETCARGQILYTNPARADKEWELYKELYVSMKQKVMNVIRHRDVMAEGGFNNLFIGWGLHSALRSLAPRILLGDLLNYSDKTRRFVDAQDAFTYLSTNPTDPENPEYATSLRAYMNFAKSYQYQRCGTCPVATEFLALLNGFVMEKKLTQFVTLPDAPPLTLTRNLVNAFSIRDALAYDWSPEISGDRLKVEIKTKGGRVCFIEMVPNGGAIDWQKIRFFISISEAGSANKFRLRAITDDGNEVIITGYSSCMNMTECNLPTICQRTPLLDDMQTFMDYLLTGNRHQQSSLRVHTAGTNTPHFGADLRALHPDFKTWDWKYTGWSSGYHTGKLTISKPGDGILSLAPVIQTCDFRFKVQNGYSLNDIFHVIGIRSTSQKKKDQCKLYDFVLVANNTKGQIFTIEASSTCYAITDCCKQTVAGGSCEIPFTPVIPVPVNMCLENALGLARENAERQFDDIRESEIIRVRKEYIDHCLRTAEQFTLTYDEAIYHHTLYYYDQAGNLVQTIPPKGIDLLSPAEITAVQRARETETTADNVYPDHQLKTIYRYNTLNQVIKMATPDGDTTRYCHDELGRVILSQTAEQTATGTCSYLNYDPLGRVIESGKLIARAGAFPQALTYTLYKNLWLTRTRSEIFKTHYDQPLRTEILSLFHDQPLYLRNRVASITYQEVASDVYDHATHYRYDVLGNVCELIQENTLLARTHPAIADAGHHQKRVRYAYDLVSSNVNKITYQPDQPDQFIHEYKYDADNRLIGVSTSTHANEDVFVKDIDAAFSYYRYGPLARQTLGMEKVQGLDFAYTLQGWLKGINSSTLSPHRDMGRDATSTGAGSRGVVAQDAFGYSLSYFSNDYKPAGAAALGESMFTPSTTGSDLENGSLYNGNIRHLEIGNDAFADNKVQAQAFRYDQLGRLTDMNIFRNADVATSNAWTGGSLVDDYRSTYRYDANGNMQNLTRNGADGAPLDDLTYHYDSPATNNRLLSVSDAVTTEYALDLESQETGNYSYDRNGRLTKDAAEGISAITWSNDDKVKEIRNTEDTLRFSYDAQGRRVTKTAGGYVFYDVRDMVGNILASYQIRNDSVVWEQAPIYSNKRIGVYQPNKLLTQTVTTHHTQRRGQKHYELTGHTGDVLATVTDRKVPSTFGASEIFYADISSAHDYYPFGMTMPGRSLDTLNYAFGFQGMKCDDAVKGKGNSYTTEFRQYDPRVGRWLSMDPLSGKFPHISPYAGLDNNPILLVDPLGSETSVESAPTYDNPHLAPFRDADRQYYIDEFREDSRELFGIELQENNGVLTLADVTAALARADELNREFAITLAGDPEALTNARDQLREFVETMMPDGTQATGPDGTVYESRHTRVILDRTRTSDNSMAYPGVGRDATVLADPLFSPVELSEYRPNGSAEGAAFALHPNIDRVMGPVLIFLHERVHNTRGLRDPLPGAIMRIPGPTETIVNGLRRGLGLPTRRVYGNYWPHSGGRLFPFDGGNFFVPSSRRRPAWAP